ncbi:dTDP-4-dehydrorhamnose 3,5-epimerase [Sungkyunkwania multivorans]|uniref:dTDP-4-dehydrorhamnose 3,5-epimerase n=1 Tax=Sungkyunkwania multivorans TaxID=1173618 RepID=A0ABW3CZP3_9FLAO
MLDIVHTQLEGCFVLTTKVFKDNRGWFSESYHQNRFEKATGYKVDFVQDNESYSTEGVLRGLHFQKGEYAQAKLVRAVYGKVLDVVVDCRKNSPTFGQYFSEILTSENRKQLFVPKGFAHGFYTLSKEAIVQYKCDNYYHKEAESGIIYNDPELAIDWQLNGRPVLSEKDLQLPRFKDIEI